MASGAVIGALVGGLVCVVGLIIAFSRKGSIEGISYTSRRRKIHLAHDGADAYQLLRGLSMTGRYRLDAEDPQRGILVFASSPTLASWGFFHSVQITPAGPGAGSIVEVDIKSRLFQLGPVVTHHHDKFCSAIQERERAALPAARVVS